MQEYLLLLARCIINRMSKENPMESKKVIVESADNIATSRVFNNHIEPGTVMKKMEHKVVEFGLNEIIKSCPKEFLRTLTERLQEVKFKYNANERELVMVADALVANLKDYVEKKVKNPMTTEEAIEEVRKIILQSQSGAYN